MTQVGDDFVDLIASFTNYIQNERVRAYNEGVDMILENVQQWARLHVPTAKMDSDNIPDLLDEIKNGLIFGEVTAPGGKDG